MLSVLLICVNAVTAVATTESEYLQLAEDTVLHASALATGELDLETAPPAPPAAPPAPLDAEAESPREAAPTAATAAAAAVRTEEAPVDPPPSKPKPAAKAATPRAKGPTSERLVLSAETVPVFKFVAKTNAEGQEAHFLVLLEGTMEFEVPSVVVYLFPVICCAALFTTWLLCCFRSDRSGFSCRLAVEAMACFPCLWAELATKYKSASACRNWTYVYAMMALICIGSACATAFESKDVIRIVFYSLFGIFWAAFTYERVQARKVFRRTVDPFTENHTCSDCTVTMCCAPMSAMQEAHIMATVEPPQSGAKPDTW